jgi:hypothetical protein
VEVVQVFFLDGRLFSRGRALNSALGLCGDDDLVVVLDVDVAVRADFFLNCLAFARRGHSMYFPIMFSRFSPELITGFVEAMGLATGDWVAKPETVTPDTGLWRDFSLGMVAMFAGDARAVGLFDADLEGWGTEDVLFFSRAQAAGYMLWRPYDLKEIHLYHPKECENLRGTDRYPMCLRSKFRLEGTQLQVAVALHKHREAAALRWAGAGGGGSGGGGGGSAAAGGGPGGHGAWAASTRKDTGRRPSTTGKDGHWPSATGNIPPKQGRFDHKPKK